LKSAAAILSRKLLKPRLLIFINRLVVGGISNDVVSLAYNLKNEFDIMILYGEKGEGEEEAMYLLKKYPGLSIKKIHYLRKKINPLNELIAFFQIRKTIREFNCDIIHTHGSKSGVLGRIAAYLSGVPCIVHTFHGHLFHSYYNTLVSKFIVLLERWLASFTSKIIATGKQQWEELVNIYKIARPDKISIIDLGIDSNAFLCNNRDLKESFRIKYALANDTVAVGIIARITEIKNFHLFTEVVERVLQVTTIPVKFFVVGDGILKKQVQHKLNIKNIRWCNTKDFNGGSSVIFTSWVPEVANVINGLDIVILTSNNEGTGLSLVEAQLCGKPVIATNVGGVRDTLIDGETGFFVEPGNVDEFAAKLNMLIQNKTLRNTMGKNASAFAERHFSKEAEVKRTKQLYNQLLSKKGRFQ